MVGAQELRDGRVTRPQGKLADAVHAHAEKDMCRRLAQTAVSCMPSVWYAIHLSLHCNVVVMVSRIATRRTAKFSLNQSWSWCTSQEKLSVNKGIAMRRSNSCGWRPREVVVRMQNHGRPAGRWYALGDIKVRVEHVSTVARLICVAVYQTLPSPPPPLLLPTPALHSSRF